MTIEHPSPDTGDLRDDLSTPHALIVRIGRGHVSIPVCAPLFNRYVRQFAADIRSERKRERYFTLMELVRAAYLHGWNEGRASIRFRISARCAAAPTATACRAEGASGPSPSAEGAAPSGPASGSPSRSAAASA